MVSYSSWNGVKMHANRDLVTGFLKNTLKFKVIVYFVFFVIHNYIIVLRYSCFMQWKAAIKCFLTLFFLTYFIAMLSCISIMKNRPRDTQYDFNMATQEHSKIVTWVTCHGINIDIKLYNTQMWIEAWKTANVWKSSRVYLNCVKILKMSKRSLKISYYPESPNHQPPHSQKLKRRKVFIHSLI